MRRFFLLIAVITALAFCSGGLVSEAVYQPVVHNPFSQFAPAAATPSVNLSFEPGVDGRPFANTDAGEAHAGGAKPPLPGAGMPENWLDASSVFLAPPRDPPQEFGPAKPPVMKHARSYNGNDGELAAALANSVFFHDDARRGDWWAYLQRGDDFILFCCRIHLFEMLSAQ